MSANPAASATSESAEPARNLLVARDVHKSFGQTEVLKGIDLTVTEGEVVALIGASGSGKTTFLRCINLLEEFEQGSITVDGCVRSSMRMRAGWMSGWVLK